MPGWSGSPTRKALANRHILPPLDRRGRWQSLSTTSEGCPVAARGTGLRQPDWMNPLNLIRVMAAKEREFRLSSSKVIVVGAGVAGLACALELEERGLSVEVIDLGRRLGEASCSWMA